MRKRKGNKRKDRRNGVKREVHNIPDELDLKFWKEDLDGFMVKLDEEGRLLPKHSGSLLRSALRQVWLRAPNKLAFLLSRQKPDYDIKERRRWKFQCDCCEGWFKKTEVEVDHIYGENTLTDPDDFGEFFEKVLNAPHSDLQMLCKGCHEIKTYGERYNIPFEKAKAAKFAIKLEKDKKVFDYLEENGIIPAKNMKLRRQQIIDNEIGEGYG